MTVSLRDCVEHIRQAASDAYGFVDGMAKADFMSDMRTQRAVIMSIVIIGEAATRILDSYSTFATAHPQVPWQSMRGMRNRLAHGYFEIDLERVWETVQTALPQLLKQLSDLQVPDEAPTSSPSGKSAGPKPP